MDNSELEAIKEDVMKLLERLREIYCQGNAGAHSVLTDIERHAKESLASRYSSALPHD